MPLRLEQGFVTAPAAIEHSPVTMLIDTGAERTLVTPGAVEALGLAADPQRRSNLRGTGGTVAVPNARLQSFSFGNMEMLDQSYAVTHLPTEGRIGFRASGVIGADWLSDYDVDLDLPQRRMTLYRVNGCTGDYLPWRGLRIREQVTTVGRGLFLMKLSLNNTPIMALLDSGAVRSVVSNAAAAQAGVTVDALEHDPAGHSMGVDGTERTMRAHRFDTLAIGSDHLRNPRLMVGPLVTTWGAEMLLGVDWLRGHRIWIDYRDQTVFIQPRSIAQTVVR